MNRQWLARAGAAALLLIIFGVPAVLVPAVMNDVPDRSRTRVLSVHQEAANIIEATFKKHRTRYHPGRVAPLPRTSADWIRLINPLGRKAPGGGPAILTEANDLTGAIGLEGDEFQVVLTVPHYRKLKAHKWAIHATGERSQGSAVPDQQ